MRHRQSQKDFFELNAEKCSKAFLAEKSYIMIHTYYLKKGINLKHELRKSWKELFGKELADETYEYLLAMAPVMLRNNILEETRKGQEINSIKFIARSLVAFEFDLWIIERSRAGKKLPLTEFQLYLQEKYGHFLDIQYDFFERYDLKYIAKFEPIARALDPYYDDILNMFMLITNNNRMKIGFENEKVSRVDFKDSKDSKDSKISAETTEPEPAPEPALPLPPKAGGSEREYQIILRERDERIAKLESDIKEFKRQRDEAREYSANQYDRGIKDLFSAMNDIRYGKVIDYLYSLRQKPGLDENLASYLDNLFMAFEDMELEPIVRNGKPGVDKDGLIKNYNLDFDKSQYDAKKVRLKYAGWKYKDIPLEKPTLTLKEE